MVDIGCGTKPYKKYFQNHVKSYFGVDSNDAKKAHFDQHTEADHYADCTNTQLEANRFDTLLSTQVMEHVLNTSDYLTECHRLLKPNGIGIFTVPFVWPLHAEPNDYYRFTRFSLEELFRKHGFQIVELRPIGKSYATLQQMKILAKYCMPLQNTLLKIIRRLINFISIPVINVLALKLDGTLGTDSLCLNYSIVVKRV